MPISDLFNLTGGINLTDSPFAIKDTQATNQSFNYDYLKTGAVSKVLGHGRISATPDTQLNTLGLLQYYSTTGTTKEAIRAAGTKIQRLNTDTAATTNLFEDTNASNSDFLASGSVQQVVSAPFNTSEGAVTWMAGGGMNAIYGYNGTNITKNGADVPTGSFTLTQGAGAGVWSATGIRYYAIVLRKTGTQSYSNAALDLSVNVTNTADVININLAGLTIDTTKYDQILIYRSAVSGVTGFTTGDLVTTLASTAASYVDTGSSSASSVVVPRAGNTTDNSVLATGTYKYLTAFKRRLVTASNSTFYISDLDKPESWPAENTVTIPSGGPITGLATIGFNSPFSQGIDEFLVIFKDREIWAFDGTSIEDWQLKFVDNVGCIQQAMVISFNGFIAWLNYNGIYLWDGAGKPIYCSRLLEGLFSVDGDLDKTQLYKGWGVYLRKTNQIAWRVSHRTKGTNSLSIKMDTRLTAPQVSAQLDSKIADGIFSLDTERALYAGISFNPQVSNDEIFVTGDNSGYLYKMYSATANPDSGGILFDYETRPMDMGKPSVKKRYKKVIAWVEKLLRKDLTLYYWTDFRQRVDNRSKIVAPMDPTTNSLAGLWDIAYWDVAFWDDYEPDIGPVTFYLHANENNAEGDTLKLKFEQLESGAPVRLHGFSVEWENIGDTR